MTTQERKRVATWIVGALLLPLGAWSFQRYDASKLDVSRYEREQAGVDGKLQRILDVACDGRRETVRACQNER